VWLHGGGFEAGAGGVILYDGRFWAAESDMVLVTINYRLGPLGFLSWNHLEEGEDTVGNYGLMDQELALQWVQDNIGEFNGDKTKVQVFGQSAGGMSIEAHLMREKDRPADKKLFNSAVLHSSPYHIAFKESWEAGIQAAHFAREIGCQTMDKDCLRGKSYDEVMEAKGKTNSIVNRDKLFLAAVQWGPTIDGNYLKQQPFDALRNGEFDKTKNIMTGMTTHESEIFVREIFREPMNDFGFVFACRALFHALPNSKELLNTIFESYNMAYGPGKEFPSCNSTVGDWTPIGSLTPDGEMPEIFTPQFTNISDTLRGHWDGMLTAEKTPFDNETPCEKLQAACNQIPDGLLGDKTVCDKLCSNVNICPKDPDQRNDLEIPATDLTFLCPERSFALNNLEKDIYVYQFANLMPADIREIGLHTCRDKCDAKCEKDCEDVTDCQETCTNDCIADDCRPGFSTYERCFESISCHAAELPYMFDSARRVQCNNPALNKDVFIYCDEDTGRIYPEEQEYMARSMKRYWANFARNGDPNNDEGGFYPENVYGNPLEELVKWDAFNVNQGRLMIQNEDVVENLHGTKIKMENHYMEQVCDTWDEVDVYLRI